MGLRLISFATSIRRRFLSARFRGERASASAYADRRAHRARQRQTPIWALVSDELAAALRHALELDPDYEHARRNLAMLAETRANGKPVGMALTEPFKTEPIRKSLTFRVDE